MQLNIMASLLPHCLSEVFVSVNIISIIEQVFLFAFSSVDICYLNVI